MGLIRLAVNVKIVGLGCKEALVWLVSYIPYAWFQIQETFRMLDLKTQEIVGMFSSLNYVCSI